MQEVKFRLPSTIQPEITQTSSALHKSESLRKQDGPEGFQLVRAVNNFVVHLGLDLSPTRSELLTGTNMKQSPS